MITDPLMVTFKVSSSVHSSCEVKELETVVSQPSVLASFEFIKKIKMKINLIKIKFFILIYFLKLI